MRPSLFFTTSLTLSSHFRRHSIVRQVRAASSSLHATTRNSDGTIIIKPDDESLHSASVILCHGLGDTAMGWEQPAQVRIQCDLFATLLIVQSISDCTYLCSHHMLTSYAHIICSHHMHIHFYSI